jgi:hypothetical protein
MKGVSGGYSIIVNEDVGPGSAWVWICILKDLHVADPDAFNERTLRLFPTHSRNPSDIAVLEYTGVRVWFYGDGKVRIQPKTESADVALRRIGRSRGLEVEDR